MLFYMIVHYFANNVKKSLTITKTYDNIKAHRNSVHKSKISKQKTKKDLQKDVDKYTEMMYNKDKLKTTASVKRTFITRSQVKVLKTCT